MANYAASVLAQGSNNYVHTLPYGECSTAADTAAKVVDAGTFALNKGAKVTVKFTNANNAASPTLNVSSTGAKPIVQYGTTAANATTTTGGWLAGAVITFTYDGTSWVRDYWYNSTYWSDAVQCTTAAGTAAKTGSTSFYDLASNRYIYVMIRYSNSYAGAITLNINSKGAKPIYINGTASSSSNYTLPAGMYLVYYNGTNYYFRTDGVIQGGSFAGNSSTTTKLATARTIRTNLASTSTASFDGTANITPGVTGTLPVANGGTGQTTLKAAANALINGLETGTSTPVDADYYIAQYVGGGTSNTNYYRRPMSALWKYIQGKGVATKGLYTSTLTTAGWTAATTGYTQTLPVTGVTATDTPVIGVVLTGTAATDQTLLDGWNLVSRVTTAANSITVYCYGEKPTVALPLQILCVR